MSADSPSPQDVADAARKHVLSLPREELDSVTLRQIKRAVEKRLGMTEGTADAEVYASAVREAATSALTAAKSESEPLGQPQQQAQPRKREAESPPADQRQPAAKKAKTDGVPEKNADGAYLFELAPLVFAKAYKFKSFKMVDVRKYYEDKNTGEAKPTGKGISMQVAQWEELKRRAGDIDQALDLL